MTPASFERDCPDTYRRLQEEVSGRAVHAIRMEVLLDDAGPFLRLTAVMTDGVAVLDSREPWQARTVH